MHPPDVFPPRFFSFASPVTFIFSVVVFAYPGGSGFFARKKGDVLLHRQGLRESPELLLRVAGAL
jgi:hypothetical protein